MRVLLVAQDRETIVQELRTAIAEAADALRPIEAAEVTDRDIVRAPAEDKDEE
jgi:flavin-binding protein dodecin